MKLPWKREPEDLVGWQVDELSARDGATRALITPHTMQAGTSWTNPWREHVGAEVWGHEAGAGILFLPEEVGFPGDETLAASGGWCAPSEVIYSMEQAMRPSTHPSSLVPLMVSVPAVQVRRGGVRQPASRRPTPARPDKPYPNPAFLAASVANPGLLPLAFMRDPTAP